MVAVVGIALGVFTLWGLANPFVGLIGLLFAAIVQPGELYPIFATLHVETLMALITLVSFIAHGGSLKLHMISQRLLYFWGSMWFAVPLSFWPGWAISFSLDFGHTVLYHILIANLVNTARRFKIFVVTFILLVGWHAASAVWLYSSGVYYSLGGNLNRSAGLTSLSDQPNSLGLMIVAAVPLACLGLLKGTQAWLRLLIAGLLCLFVWAILTTNSRASFFSLVLLFGIYAFTRKRAIFAIPVVAIVLLIGWQIMPQEFKNRYTTDLKTDDSYLNRVRAWEAGKAMFYDNPVTGVGPGCFTYANGGKYWVGSGRKIWLNAHSLFVQLPAELGVVGVITFTLFLGAVYRENRRLKKILADNASPFLRMWPVACSFSLLAWIIAGYSSHDLYRGNWFMLAALTAAATTLRPTATPLPEPVIAGTQELVAQ
jgi:O-antigen ligase